MKKLKINSTGAWGRPYWNFLHVMALFYDPNDVVKIKSKKLRQKTQMKTFLTKTLPLMIPCGHCRSDYVRFLYKKKNKNPHWKIAIQSRKNLMFFLFSCHNNSHDKTMKLSTFKQIYADFL